jgi:PadR family transcriptional regulator PadR
VSDDPAGGIRPLSRLTLPVLAVLAVLADGQDWYGLRVAGLAGLGIGTAYPILARLEQAGWVVSTWEDGAGVVRPGARRKYYHLTPGGLEQARAVLAARKGRQAEACLTRDSGMQDP